MPIKIIDTLQDKVEALSASQETTRFLLNHIMNLFDSDEKRLCDGAVRYAYTTARGLLPALFDRLIAEEVETKKIVDMLYPSSPENKE